MKENELGEILHSIQKFERRNYLLDLVVEGRL